MAQHDYSIANQSGAAFRADLNNALAAIVSQNSGASEPSTTYAYQWWGDTTTGLLKIRNAANSAWVTVGTLASANLGLAPVASPSFTGTATFAGDVNLSGTGYLDLPAGTTAQRPGSPNSGMIRFNSTLGQFEGHNGTAWGQIGGLELAGVSDVTGINTTGTVTSGTTSLTVASATGITAGMFVVGEGIAPGTTVSSIVSTTVTLSANANATLSSDPVTFYNASKVLSPAVVGGMLCRAWVNFNGTSTVAIRFSYNVSSITDNGTGDYTVNFTTAFANTNYTSISTVSNNTGLARIYAVQPVNTATNTCRIYIGNPTGVADTTAAATDHAAIYAAFFA